MRKLTEKQQNFLRALEEHNHNNILRTMTKYNEFYGGMYKIAKALEKRGLITIDRSKIPHIVSLAIKNEHKVAKEAKHDTVSDMLQTEYPHIFSSCATRNLSIKIFYASTIGALQTKINNWISSTNICIDNHVNNELQQLGNIYTLTVTYATIETEESV